MYHACSLSTHYIQHLPNLLAGIKSVLWYESCYNLQFKITFWNYKTVTWHFFSILNENVTISKYVLLRNLRQDCPCHCITKLNYANNNCKLFSFNLHFIFTFQHVSSYMEIEIFSVFYTMHTYLVHLIILSKHL